MTNSKEKQAFENPIELVLQATPEVLNPVIKTAAAEFEFEDLRYWSAEETKSASAAFTKILIGTIKIEGDSIASEDCIGIITLQSLSKDKTLFRIPPRSQWHINIYPKTLPLLAEGEETSHISNDKFYWFQDERYFTRFLEKLLYEFQRLGFIDLKQEKPPIGFKLPHREKNDQTI